MPTLSGFAFDSAGVALSSGITVNIYARNTTTPVVSTTSTNASGYWTRPGLAEGRYDVEIVNGTTIRRMMYDDEIQIERGEFKNLQVRGSDNAFAYTLAGGAIAAARTLNLPIITGTDTIAVLSLAQTFSTGVKTFNSSILAIRNPADTFSYTVVASAITAARNLTVPLIAADDTLAVLGLAQTFSATQTFSAAAAAAFGSNTVTGAFTASGATITFSGGTASTSTSTGTIVISGSGGLGIGGAGYFGGILTVSKTASTAVLGTLAGNAIEFYADVTPNGPALFYPSTAPLRFGTQTSLGAGGFVERLRFTENGQVKVAGSATRATTEGTNHLDIFDGTAPVGTLANGVSLYSTTGELRVMDSAGNATLLSPHASDGSWIYDSVSPVTGKHLRVDMERMVKWLNEKFGQDWVKELEIGPCQ